ncbi:MAG: hypothetical protein SGARI_004148, partial [Bacillariaceae sp.]
MELYRIPYQDVRYPIQAAAKGFGVNEVYLTHQADGHFKSNMNRVPILQIVQRTVIAAEAAGDDDAKSEEKILAEMGQTHSILRFLDEQHGNS